MPSPPSGRQVRLSAHDQELVAVEVGGGLRSYRAASAASGGGLENILDPYGEDEMCSGGRGQLLAPWPNRLGGGLFEWQGRRLQTALTEVEHGNAIHGLVRWANWSVPDPTPTPWGPQTPPDTTQLSYRLHPQPGWPWTLDWRVTYRLVAGRGLEVRTAVSNVSGEPCPFGFGWHPYLLAFGGLVDGCRLELPAATAYRSDERGLPVGQFAVAGTNLDFTRLRPIGPEKLDVAFTELRRAPDGRATVRFRGDDDETGVDLWVDGNYTHLMVFSGDTLSDPRRRRRGLAVEPMTGAPDLLNNGDGRRILEPGATFEATWGLDPFSPGGDGPTK